MYQRLDFKLICLILLPFHFSFSLLLAYKIDLPLNYSSPQLSYKFLFTWRNLLYFRVSNCQFNNLYLFNIVFELNNIL